MREPTEMELRVSDCLTAHLQTSTTLSLKVARAVIRAMREPTPEMYDRANRIESKSKSDLKSFDVTGFCALAYIAMIDAASPPDTAEL